MKLLQLVLYCKSFRVDVYRVRRLAQSVSEHNIEGIPFYVSVPFDDLALFRDVLSDLPLALISDEEIVCSNKSHSLDRLRAMPGNVSQQIVKSEFWRLGLCENYLCIDSDAMFIRDFGRSDFLSEDGVPYTTIDEAKDLLEAALVRGKGHVLDHFAADAQRCQQVFGRSGKHFSFGPMPVVWSRRVWQDLDLHYLTPRDMSLADAIEQLPCEMRWYGEALLKYRSIPLLPCQALFKVYHYAWQLRGAALKSAELPKLYLGVIRQSAWERELDWPREAGSWLSRRARRIRRALGLS